MGRSETLSRTLRLVETNDDTSGAARDSGARVWSLRFTPIRKVPRCESFASRSETLQFRLRVLRMRDCLVAAAMGTAAPVSDRRADSTRAHRSLGAIWR